MTPRSGLLRDEPSDSPIQIAKVQRPALRDETLERPRLLDWLRAKVHGRVVLLLADAGYGKTTLLADFSRRSRTRTLWYRLDETDRDWTSFLHHLVAAGREHDSGFAPSTAALLGEIGVGGPTREAVLDTLIRELPTITLQGGAVLIFDDFHLVDDAPDVRHIARELLARAPERMSIVFASRRLPTVPLARLRAVGEVAELGTDDLRFDASETAQLFNETYGRRLESDVLLDLAHRTEGWIASLQLVQAALRDRSPAEIRRFVRSLNGADHEMYDYLAEEVVGDLSDELQRFLMETSILQVVTPELAEVVTGQDPTGVSRLTAAAERLTLLSRLSGAPRTHQRYHPLVREFLEARFRTLHGDEVVAALHRRTAAAATDWRTAAHHYREAGDTASMLAVLSQAIPTIMGNGQYSLAEAFIGPVPVEQRPPGFDLILSRVEMQQGDYEAAIAASQAVLDSATDPIQRDYALLNLVTLNLNVGIGESVLTYADSLARSLDPELRAIAEGSIAMVVSGEDARIEPVSRLLNSMARRQRSLRAHFYAISQHNLAVTLVVAGEPASALEAIDESIEVLSEGSALIELQASRVLRSRVLAALGRLEEATAVLDDVLGERPDHRPLEVPIDAADLLDSYLDPGRAAFLLGQVGSPDTLTPAENRLRALVIARWSIRRRAWADAHRAISDFPRGRPTAPGITADRLVTEAYLAFMEGDARAAELSALAVAHAQRQGAHRWRRYAVVLEALASGNNRIEDAVQAHADSAESLAFLADALLERIDSFDDRTMAVVRQSAELYRARWKEAIRAVLERPASPIHAACAQLLELIGDRSDVPRLRRMARQGKRRADTANLGRALARRVAERVFIEDQGRVSIRVGERMIPGSEIRRKVLALVCFLVSRPGMSSTRDQVLEALWPDLDPEVAVNSLNQTIYFLRRVFEVDYSDDLSPGYVHHDSDVVWLDAELISARSGISRNLIRSLPSRPSPDQVQRLASTYHGRFALDFEYEEWASAYRDSLHASYLEIMERAVLDDFTNGHFDRGIGLARHALEVDSTAEQIEVSLLRLYKATGAHAAAAEQYAHYASVMRQDLGIEPPTLESL